MSTSTLPGLELSALRQFIDDSPIAPLDGELTASLIAGGRSNLTYLVSDASTTWVLRRPPLGELAATAHDMEREHRVLTGLWPTPVPVPRPVVLCRDDAVLGAPFYLMERVAGRTYQTAADLGGLGPERARALVDSLVDMLVELHRVVPAEAGLADLGRPAGFVERQVRRWSRQYAAVRTRDVPGIDELHRRLEGSIPPERDASLVHGDYRLDNVLVDDGRITAVLDWEMATIGAPLMDLALLVSRNHDLAGTEGMMFDTSLAVGFPSSAEIVARYASGSGRDVAELGWYVALAQFKRAVILEGLHHRFTQGHTVGDGFENAGRLVPAAVESGLSAFEALS